jgi:hypothetical protein
MMAFKGFGRTLKWTWHTQGIRQKGMKKFTKRAARINDENARLETGVS